MQYGTQVKIAEKPLSLLLTGRIVQIHILSRPIRESLQSGFEAVFLVSSIRLIVAPVHPGGWFSNVRKIWSEILTRQFKVGLYGRTLFRIFDQRT